MLKKFGPGVLIAAAFIGPGTITACTIAGVQYKYALLWTVFLAIIATIVLQEMSLRIGVISQKGISEVLRNSLENRWLKYTILGLVLLAIVLGNMAYEAGNIAGATLGMEVVLGDAATPYYPFILGLIAFVLLFIGSYRVIEKFFMALVLVMSLSFLVTAIITKPNLMDVLKGILVPSIPSNSLFNIMALVGTTIVPYNLFLHASLAKQKWSTPKDLQVARKDNKLSIILGGLVSLTIIICAASINSTTVLNAADLAKGLAPLYGNSATVLLGLGLFAAGITSAITAPLAAAYVAQSCFGWRKDLKDIRFRIVWILILAFGVFSLSTGIKPITIIQIAQISNGLLLPVIVILLISVVNNKRVMGAFTNSIWQNIVALAIFLLISILAIKSIFKVIGWV